MSVSTFNFLQQFGVSLSFVAVIGNRHASFPKNYEGWFTSVSFSFRNVTIGGAIGREGKAVIGSFNLGVTTSTLAFGFSQTYYILINKNGFFEKLFEPFRNTINNQLSWYTMVRFLML